MDKKLLIFIIIVTIFSFGIRLYRIEWPNHYYFDEVYHVVTAKAYADNNPAAYDPFAPPPETNTAYDWLHPPLAKLIQAGSIKVFGDKPIAWRLPGVIFGTAIIPSVFILSYLLFGKYVAIFSAVVIAFENLNLVMSRITMNDVFLVFFTLVSSILAVLYVQKRKFKYLFLTSVFLGFSVATKWSGVYAIALVSFYIIFNEIKSRKFRFSNLSLFVIPVLIYISSYGQFWFQGHSIQQFIDLHKQIWWYQNRHDLKHSYGTTPLFCVPEGLGGPKTFCPWVLDIRPVYFSYEEYATPATPERSDGGQGQKAGYIYALGNPLVFWFGFAAILYLVIKLVEKRSGEVILILLGYFIFWVPWIFAPRILFMHHYLPSLPFLSIALGMTLSKMWTENYKIAVALVIVLIALSFFYFLPISTGFPIDTTSIENYVWLKSRR